MYLGISIDKIQLKATVLDAQLNTLYSSQQSLAHTAQAVKQQVFQVVDNFQWIYSSFCYIGLAITGEVQDQLEQHQLVLDTLIEQHYRIPCSQTNFVEAGLHNSPEVLSEIKIGDVLCVVVDNECELYCYTRTRRGIPQRTMRSIPWAHVALPGYDFVLDGLVPACPCNSEACTEQFVCVSGLERQYEQILLQRANVKEIFSALDSGDPIAARTYRRYIDQLARALTPHIEQNLPKSVLMLGSVSRYAPISSDLRVALSRYCTLSPLPTIMALPYEDFSIARGAVQTKPQRLARQVRLRA
ncbi:ROK family protein [Vibrio aestuarianus]|uniref:ROK family protein n=1 Tax=Vibrio aestuarianus TaxID=28171 RepID=A0A9X4FFW9_9VIBR|nr:ROK family protein [Vibrio aestuarianus]MDE1225873.1 ROK family protein [Vibrio aestuarianus]MDE1312505.1 ROK family protein [Vibrio aestuarianus]MDE1357930.1 ROK family protein [Vibrio aestuarianus]NGZ18114.1 ROK family protein [Vibrio aestuarianus]NGZ92970.1 ROK family protein [Vibrio aestuarianus subsp. cardii]